MVEPTPVTETSLGKMTFGGVEYEVLKVEGEPWIGYRLKGPRGADYSLFRNAKTPHMMFPTNNISFVKKTAFEGRWFTDKDREGNPCQLRLI